MYFNFHTAANPGGEIRGQAIPDTFTTNAYTATATGVPNSVGDLLNAGSLSCNLVTPGGTITGRLAVDATRGQYAVASIANSAFDAAKMYTVIATGKGPTFQILKLEDRLFGVARPAIVPGPKATTRVVDPKTQAGE
jgi:hypothetical protein